MPDQFLELAQNLARYHREHEKFYARAPLEEAVTLHRTSMRFFYDNSLFGYLCGGVARAPAVRVTTEVGRVFG